MRRDPEDLEVPAVGTELRDGAGVRDGPALGEALSWKEWFGSHGMVVLFRWPVADGGRPDLPVGVLVVPPREAVPHVLAHPGGERREGDGRPPRLGIGVVQEPQQDREFGQYQVVGGRVVTAPRGLRPAPG